MEKNSLIEALRKAEAAKFTAVPPEETLEYRFSDRFQKRMGRLIRLQRSSVWQMVNTPQRRALLLFIILVATFGVRPDQNPLFRYVQPVPQLSTVVAPAKETGAQTRPSPEAPSRAEQTTASPGFAAPAAEPASAVMQPAPTEAPTYARSVQAEEPALSEAPNAQAEEPAVSEAPNAQAEEPEPEQTEAPQTENAVTERPEGYPDYVPLPGRETGQNNETAAEQNDRRDFTEMPVYSFTVPWA